MKRRAFIWLLGTALAWPRAGRAQQKALPLVGFLSVRSRDASGKRFAAFHQGLSEAGFVEGRNVAIEERWADGHYDRLPALAADLAKHRVALIATTGGPAPALAAKTAAPPLPIVFQTGDDPVADELVASFSHPGGNLTGINAMITELMPKRLELLVELVPKATAIAVLVNPSNPKESDRAIRDTEAAARTKGIHLDVLKASSESEIDAAFIRLDELRVNALLVAPDPFFSSVVGKFVALAQRHAVPALYYSRAFVAPGGLISFGTDIADTWRQLGFYVGKILNGAKPADLPVQQPTKFELVINLKTAKAIGLTVPQSLLQRADEVIE